MHAGRKSTLGLGLFLLPLGVSLVPLRTYFGYDGQMMYRVAESLVLRHSFHVTDPIWHMNEPYTYFGLAVSLLLAPFYWLGQLLQHDGLRFIVLYEPLVSAVTVLAVYLLARDFGASNRRSLLIALGYAFASLAWYYSTTIFAEPLIAATMTTGFLFLRRYAIDGRVRWLALSGSLMAIALLARWDAALLVAVPVAVYACLLLRRRLSMSWPALSGLIIFVAPIVLAFLANLWYDWLRYGDPFNLGPRAQFGGVFSTPVPVGVYGLLFSPGDGLIVFVPLVALAAAAFPAFMRRWRTEAIVIALLFGLRLLLYAQWSYWDGREWGPRFLVPVVPLLLLVLVASPDTRRWRAAAIVLAGIGIAVEVIGQLVPYDTIVWPATAPLVVSIFHLHDAAGSSCLCSRAVDQAASTAMDFDPRYAPVVRQVVLLARGVIDPTWQSAWPILTAAYGTAAGVAAYLWRMASRLDDASPRADQQPHSERIAS